MRKNTVKITLLLLLAASFVFAASAGAVGQQLELQPAAVQGIPPDGSAVLVQPKGVQGPANYIIQLAAPAAASYAGGINGLAATNPRANNQADLRPGAALDAYVAYLVDAQRQFGQDLRAVLGRSVEFRRSFQHAFNGVVVQLTPDEAALVANMSGVRLVARETIEHPTTDVGPTWIGANSIWDGSATGVATKGEDVVVAILDTGINHDHPSFADIGGDGYDHTNPLGSGNYIPGSYCVTDDPTFCNDKVIGAWDEMGPVADPDAPEDNEGHGSHTASTTAGNVVEATLYAPTDTITATISGVAPHANIIMYDVCVNNSCPGSALLAAVNQVVIDHAYLLGQGHPTGISTINYSISGGNDPYNDAVSLAFLAANDAGVHVSASAGNAGPGPSTMGHQEPWTTSVGAMTHNRKLIDDLIDLTSDGGPLADISGAGFTTGYGPAPIVYAGDYPSDLTDTPELCGVGVLGDFISPWPPGTFSGEIVICDRGIYGRVEKGANVLVAGAGGMVLVDNGAGIVADPHVLPATHITQADGAVLEAWVAGNTNTMATISGTLADYSPSNGDIMAGFSSRGPNDALDVVKPNVAAPGVSIWAAVATLGQPSPEYDFYSGTSMASPHNAGSAALLTALHPDWTPQQIQSALMTTSINTTGLKEDGVTPTDPWDLGAGRIRVNLAAAAGLVLDETETNFSAADPGAGGDPKTLNLASMMDSQCTVACGWQRTVTNPTADTVSWTASFDLPAGMTATVTPDMFTLGPGESVTLDIQVDVSAVAPGDWAFAQLNLEPAPPTLNSGGASLACNTSVDFGAGIPGDWTVADNEGSGVVWGDLAGCGESGNFTGGAGDVACASSDVFGTAEFDTELWTNTLDLSTATAATLDYMVNYQNYAGLDRLAVDVSTDGGSNWTNLLLWDSDHGAFRATPGEAVSLDLTPYVGGSNVIVRWHYYDPNTSDWDWYVQVDDVALTCEGGGGGGGVPSAHMPIAVVPASGSVPDAVDIETRRDTGSQLVGGIVSGSDVTDLTATVAGLAAADIANFDLAVDPTNGDPFDDLSQVYYAVINVPADTYALIAEITATSALDNDLYVGQDTNGNMMPDSGETVCTSATAAALEACAIDAPAEGDWWVLVQNWEGSGAPTDSETLATAVVPMADSGNMWVEGPMSVPGGEAFEIELYWDIMSMTRAMAGDVFYGAVTLGTDPGNPDNIGSFPVRLYRQLDDVSKTASTATAMVGDVVTYTITVQPNITPVDLTYMITDTLPSGMTLVPGSASATAGTVSEMGNSVMWTGVMPAAGFYYAVTDTATTPTCVMPLSSSDNEPDAYVNLQAFGILANPAISGDTFDFFVTNGPYEFFGASQGDHLHFTDDGFAFFEPATPGAAPWVNLPIPTAGDPDNMIATWWRDWIVNYDAGLNHGVSLATLSSGGVPVASLVEYDDVQDWPGGGADAVDYEFVVYFTPSPSRYEVIMAYKNLNNPTLSLGTVGVENLGATEGEQVYYDNVAVTSGSAICFDWTEASTDAVTITYAATANDSACNSTQTNMAEHVTDNPGDMVATASVDVDVFCAAPSIELAKTVGTDPNSCATDDSITVTEGDAVTYCYTVTNTGNITLPLHDLVDDQLGTILLSFPYDLAPGASVFVTQTTTVMTDTMNTATWTAYDNAGLSATASDSAMVMTEPAPVASIEVVKTVGTDPATCAATDSIQVNAGDEVTYCYTVTNTGNITLTHHDVTDDHLGDLLTAFAYDLGPGASVSITQTATINADVTNVVTWTAYIPGALSAMATDSATVTVAPTDVALAGFGGTTTNTWLPVAAIVIAAALGVFVIRRRRAVQ